MDSMKGRGEAPRSRMPTLYGIVTQNETIMSSEGIKIQRQVHAGSIKTVEKIICVDTKEVKKKMRTLLHRIGEHILTQAYYT